MSSALAAPGGEHPPTRPCLPPRLRSLLAATETRALFAADGGLTVVELGWTPPPVGTAEAGLAASLLAQYDAYLAPAGGRWIVGRVTALLAQFFVPDMPESLARAVIDDWQRVLAPFPRWAIDAACLRWLEERSQRPLPAQIRALCQQAVAEAASERRKLRRLAEAHRPAAEPAPARHPDLTELRARYPRAFGLATGGELV